MSFSIPGYSELEPVELCELTVAMVEGAARRGVGKKYALDLLKQWTGAELAPYYISRQERMDRYNAALQGRLVHVDR